MIKGHELTSKNFKGLRCAPVLKRQVLSTPSPHWSPKYAFLKLNSCKLYKEVFFKCSLAHLAFSIYIPVSSLQVMVTSLHKPDEPSLEENCPYEPW